MDSAKKVKMENSLHFCWFRLLLNKHYHYTWFNTVCSSCWSCNTFNLKIKKILQCMTKDDRSPITQTPFRQNRTGFKNKDERGPANAINLRFLVDIPTIKHKCARKNCISLIELMLDSIYLPSRSIGHFSFRWLPQESVGILYPIESAA